MLVHSLYFPTVSSVSPNKTPHKPLPPSSSTHPPLLIRFPTSHRENIRYLKSLNIISPTTKKKFFSPQTIHQILTLINYLKYKSFSDQQIKKLAFLCPELFSSDIVPTDINPVFEFLTTSLLASQDDSRDLILRCPDLLLSDIDDSLRPTLDFLKDLGLKKLNSPSNLNAHLLNTRVDKFVEKIGYLQSLGLTNDEARRVCGRLPAIFGYSIENNLRGKVEYLAEEMERCVVEELKVFPQYFAFSLDTRIVPRHLHLKARNVDLSLQKMLLWSDQRFYAKWK
ncbi:hypothetical protein IFM89_016243 [Coptis chinensis]|uniref:Uncharacterized protein n=1 Tax=Coptis chinensis TaxID=261450 RepID=A0A835LV79_9MAGN|nr:hypothetical protein IFM89_016243 [Coptis chinensis]